MGSDNAMTTPNIVTGQKINPAKLERARAMRRNMMPAERRLWNALRANRLDGFHFRRQQIVGGFIVDFYCHAAALVVEVDGPVHDGQVDYDASRDEIIAAHGLHVVRFRNEEVMRELDAVLARIRHLCHTRLPSPPRGGAGGGVK